MNNRGFTLIEMMIVLLIISILLLVTIPNITKNNNTVKGTGCRALVKMVEAQLQAYEIDHGAQPESLDKLVEEGYLETYTCPGELGDVRYENGKVIPPNPEE